MKKDTKGNSSPISYIILVLVLLIAVVAIFMLLHSAKEQAKAKPLTTTTTTRMVDVQGEGNTTTTVATTTKKLSIYEEVQGTTTTKVVIQEEIKVDNFTASLETIIDGASFDFDYKVSKDYSGAKFNFNCTKYDEKNLICTEGSGLMNIGTGLYPLYTYKNSEDNILHHQYDYFIVITDKYVILTETYSFRNSGVAKIYDRNGTFITSVDNVIMGYKVGNKQHIRIHPTLNENILYYYSCDDSVVHVTSLNLDDMTISFADTIHGAVCY